MKSVYFDVKLPDDWYKITVFKRRKRVIIEKLHPIDSNSGTKDINKTAPCTIITPDQLVYAIKEFNLLDRFRYYVYHLLKQSKQNVFFEVVEPVNGRLIDHAWQVFTFIH